ncbi:MAG: glutathione-dependent formaldehyde dehydrogenase [Elusimicrobia bacterium]|nr:glutathione-dependent formaldehyde dehydrogenase [Elusimicrobiota bacterium]
MKALVFHKPKDVRLESVPDPKIEHVRDAIIRVTSTSICGSDLHIYNGYFPQARPLILGHEFMGIVEEVGPRVTNLKKGDRVVVPFPVACGECWFCRQDLPIHCERSNPKHYGPDGSMTRKGGGLFGYTDLYGSYQGGQAEYVRVPFADYGPRKVPQGMPDEKALFLSDIIPTGWAAINWCGLEGGETVAVFGCGPVGLMALKSARARGAGRVIGVDILDYRLKKAVEVAQAAVINADKTDAVEAIRQMTTGRGADACVDAVGMEAEHDILESASNVVKAQVGTMRVLASAMKAARRSGTVSVVGVYGTDFDNFPLGQLFDKGLRLRAGQAPVHAHIDGLLDMVAQGSLRADDIVTHRLPLEEGPRAYKIFNEKREGCVKVMLKP